MTTKIPSQMAWTFTVGGFFSADRKIRTQSTNERRNYEDCCIRDIQNEYALDQ
jgi:hypothetical protein